MCDALGLRRSRPPRTRNDRLAQGHRHPPASLPRALRRPRRRCSTQERHGMQDRTDHSVRQRCRPRAGVLGNASRIQARCRLPEPRLLRHANHAARLPAARLRSASGRPTRPGSKCALWRRGATLAASRRPTQTCLRHRTGISSATPRALLSAETEHPARDRFRLSERRAAHHRYGDAGVAR